MTTKTNQNSANDSLERESSRELPLVKRNFVAMAIAAIFIVVGFLLMLGGSSTFEEFNADIFSVRRTVIGPTICFAGYVLMAVALLLKPNKKEEMFNAEEGSQI